MSSRVVRLTGMRFRRPGWTGQELAALRLLMTGFMGFSFETDHGVSDEGEPWFVFHDSDSDEVLAHFARIGGNYVVCAPCIKGSLSATELRELVKRFMERCGCWQGTTPCIRSTG